MHEALTRSILENAIAQVQHGLPSQLEPGYDIHVDFSELTSQVFRLERQHLVLRVAHWIAGNAPWLETEGLSLASHLLPGGPDSHLLACMTSEVHARLLKDPKLSAARHTVVADLVHTLHRATPSHHGGFIAELVFDLNAVRWEPRQAQCVLVEALDDFMDDGEQWLQAHQSWAQAETLRALTHTVRAERARGRL